MITSLTELTMRDYVALVCGDTSVLHARHDIVSPAKLQSVRAALMFEFAKISDEAGTKSAMNQRRGDMSVKAELMLFKVCTNLLNIGAIAEVRSIISRYGIDEKRMTDEQVGKEVTRLLKRCETDAKRQDTGKPSEGNRRTADEIRRHYDRQAAMLMTYFKFQIDLGTITASQFACMTDQANREIKAKIASLNKH